MAAKRASLADRQPKRTQEQERGRGVEALFEPPPAGEKTARNATSESNADLPPKSSKEAIREQPKTATFNLYPQHQNFLDEFVRQGKQQFREQHVGVGAINKSAVLQELLEVLQRDDMLQKKVIRSLEKRERTKGSRHNPYKYQ